MKVTLLLTGCVNPQKISQLSLTDANERLKQYVDALYYYLDETNYNIVFVDNSNFDLSPFFLNHKENHRLELLHFDGNNYNPTLGKGYGEALIIQYAFLHSIFLKETDFVVKITGRLKILNIIKLISISAKDKNTVSVDVDLKLHYAQSQFFVIPVHFYYHYFSNMMFEINDTGGVHFEHILALTLKKWLRDKNKVNIFSKAINLSGISGSTGVTYLKPSFKTKTIKYIKSMLWHIGLSRFSAKY